MSALSIKALCIICCFSWQSVFPDYWSISFIYSHPSTRCSEALTFSMTGLVRSHLVPTNSWCHRSQRLRQLHEESIRRQMEEACIASNSLRPSIASPTRCTSEVIALIPNPRCIIYDHGVHTWACYCMESSCMGCTCIALALLTLARAHRETTKVVDVGKVVDRSPCRWVVDQSCKWAGRSFNCA